MKRKLLIRDLTLRDGQQSQFATRMTQKQIDRVLPYYKEAHFYACEIWGGAIPDSIMRYLNEDPWQRLEKIKSAIGNASKLTALSRGRNLFGYNPYPESVISGFNHMAVSSGVDIMRIFDALNDLENMRSTIKYVKEAGGIADCAVCYTVDPHFAYVEKVIAFFTGRKIPEKIFTVDYFVDKAKKLEKMGADIITIKDMAGLIPPDVAGELTKKLKKKIKVPIDLHTHCTPGYGVATLLKAIVNGCDIVDTVLLNFAGGPAAPAFEIIQLFADKLGLDTGVDLTAVSKINKELRDIRTELAQFDESKRFPREFDLLKSKLPKKINKLFDDSIDFALTDKDEELIAATQEIEKYFNFPEGDEIVKTAQIPGGMYTNMVSQLKQAGLENMYDRVLAIIPSVRLDAGLPPLVTPTSQIVGVQAVNCVVDESKGKEWYTNTSTQFVNLVKGLYGKTPIPIDPDFREKITGVRDETPYDASNYEAQPNPLLSEFDDVPLARNEKEKLLLELFPVVASNFLKRKREIEYKKKEAELRAIEEADRRRMREEQEKFNKLSPQEKVEVLIEGLYDNW